MKIAILLLLLLIVASLFFALFAFMKDKGKSTRMVKALYVRVGLSVALIIFLIVGYNLGYLKTNMNPALVDKLIEDQKAQREQKQQ